MSDLGPHERQLLAAWAEGPVSSDFADRVLHAHARAVHGRGSRARTREVMVGAFALAALVMLTVAVGRMGVAGLRSDPTIARAVDRSSSELGALRQSAFATLERNCGPCHDGGQEAAKPTAVAVFDLAQQAWWSMMSDRQLEVTRVRVEQVPGLDGGEAQQITAYVAAELAYRASKS